VIMSLFQSRDIWEIGSQQFASTQLIWGNGLMYYWLLQSVDPFPRTCVVFT